MPVQKTTTDNKSKANDLIEALKGFKKLENPTNSKGKQTWLKQDIQGLKNCQVCKTNDGNLLLNIKLSKQRYGLFFSTEKDFEDMIEIIVPQKDKIMNFLANIEVVNDTISSGNGKVSIKI